MRKRIITSIIFGLFFISIFVLAWQIFPELHKEAKSFACTEQNNVDYQKVAEFSLGSVRAIDAKQMGAPAGFIAFSPIDDAFVVGSENGELIAYDAEGKERWREKLGLGKISFVTFVNGGAQLLVGESSPDGSLRCLDSKDGTERWRLDSRPELGDDLAQKIYPVFLSAVQNRTTGEIFAMAQRYAFNADGTRRYATRIYRLSETGQVLDKYPKERNIDVWVGTVNVDSKRNRLILGAGSFYPVPGLTYNDNVYSIDVNSGATLWSTKLDVVPPYKTATTRYAPVLSEDQNEMAFLAGDGRVFVQDYNGQPLWQRTISPPANIGGVYLNTTALDAVFTKERVLFFTSNTYNRMNWQLPTPVEHPSSNSVFFFDRSGTLLSRYAAKGTIGNMIGDENTAGLSVGINLRTRDYNAHGVVLLDMKTGAERTFLPVEGPCVRVAADSNFKHIVAVEVPMKTQNGELIGAYRVHVWRMNS